MPAPVAGAAATVTGVGFDAGAGAGGNVSVTATGCAIFLALQAGITAAATNKIEKKDRRNCFIMLKRLLIN